MSKGNQARIHETGFTTLYDPGDAAHGVVADIIIVHGLQGNPWRTWLYDPSKLQRHDASRSERDLRAQHSQPWGRRRNLGLAISGLAKAFSPSSSRRTKGVNGPVEDDGARVKLEAVYWPKDLLPADCPETRILVWGYDTTVTEGYGAVNKANIFAHAKDLLYSLERQRPKGRSIIFVAHSLGGLLVKDVLRRAQQAEEAEFNDIIESTKAVVFLGTPHRGSPGFAGLGEIARHVVSTLLKMDSNKAVIRALGLDSPELELSRESFLQQWRTYGFRVKTFQESQGFSGVRLGILGEKIVPDISSSLDDPREHAETLQADHRNMTKFWGREDPNYVKLGGELKNVITHLGHTSPAPGRSIEFAPEMEEDQAPDTSPSVELSKEEKECLSTLLFANMVNREQNIREAMDDTCWWFQDSDAFKRWYSRTNVNVDRGLLWVKGKPGSGKSTLMKHSVVWALQTQHNHATVAAFYFNARGDVLERTPIGLFRSILHQICLQDEAIRAAFLKLYQERQRKVIPGMEWSWDQAELRTFIRRVFGLGQPRRTFLFIDALDECDECTVRDLVYFFAEVGTSALANGRCLNICLSSRHYPTISLPNCPEIVVENRNGSDIANYVRGRFSFAPPSEADVVAELEDCIIEKASGVFLWSVLVVDQLLRDVDRGRPMSELKECLKQVPKTMEELYMERCQSLSAEERAFSVSLIQWVLFAKDHFQQDPYGVVFAANCSASGAQSLTDLYGAAHNGKCTPPYERTVRLINDASRGLIECTTSKSVQFIHETTREFFLTGPGLGLLDPKLLGNPKGLSYMAMVDGCVKVVEQSIPDWYSPTYTHALFTLLHYARCADEHGGSSSSLLPNINAGKLFSVDRESGESVLRFTSRQHLTSCVLDLLEQGVQADDTGDNENYSTPLLAAFHRLPAPQTAAPDIALVAGLIKHGADIECKTESSRTPLFIAAQNRWFDLALFLVESGANVNAIAGRRSVLWLLMDEHGLGDDDSVYDQVQLRRAQYLRLLEAILARGADPNHRFDSGQSSLLHRAVAFRQNVDVIRLLIQAGADVNALDGYGYSVLHVAAQAAARFQEPSDWERLRVLVEAGCSTARTSSWRLTPLAIACNVNPELGVEMREILAPERQNGIGGREAMDLFHSTRTTATRRLTIRLE